MIACKKKINPMIKLKVFHEAHIRRGLERENMLAISEMNDNYVLARIDEVQQQVALCFKESRHYLKR